MLMIMRLQSKEKGVRLSNRRETYKVQQTKETNSRKKGD